MTNERSEQYGPAEKCGYVIQKFFIPAEIGVWTWRLCLQFDLAGNIVVPIVFLYRCGTCFSGNDRYDHCDIPNI